jgi:hypothetical protein
MGLSKEELDGLMKIEGGVRGAVFQTDAGFVLQERGDEGLKKLEERVSELGYRIPYREAGSLDLYPIGLRVISLLVIKDTFGWGDDKLREMGHAAPQASFIVKLLMRFFASWGRFVGELPSYWMRHYTVGRLEVSKADEKTKEIVVHIRDFKIHPIMCVYLEGFFERIYEFIVGRGKGKVVETKCMFKGDPYHEFASTVKG